jgi:hypothetical protein
MVSFFTSTPNAQNQQGHLRRLRTSVFSTYFVTSTGWAHKSTIVLREFLVYRGLILFIIISNSLSRALWLLPAETSSSEAGETWREMAAEFEHKISLL